MKYRAGEKESARTAEEDAPVIPAGLWKKCNKCGKPIYTDDVRANFYICPKCGGYFRVHAYRRIEMIADEGSFEEWDKFMQVSNPLSFPGYEKKLAAAREKSQIMHDPRTEDRCRCLRREIFDEQHGPQRG